ncbi:hypothetical protein ACYSNR_03680 [Enterococcus sp. LJL128]|uniref:hypothetical protein n=1 Tax=Enterococcus sp. LJL51 TaxID=3416656 RepID=UPI003CE68DE1
MKKQEQAFIDFVMERTLADHKGDMDKLLGELLEKKNSGQLNKMYLMGVMPRALSYLEADKVPEVKDAVEKLLA